MAFVRFNDPEQVGGVSAFDATSASVFFSGLPDFGVVFLEITRTDNTVFTQIVSSPGQLNLSNTKGVNVFVANPLNDAYPMGTVVATVQLQNATNGNAGSITINETLTGQIDPSAPRDFVGTEFADSITGDGSANILLGLNGDDTLEGGAGADDLFGGEGDDTASYENAGNGVFVNLFNGVGTGDADGDRFSSIENLRGSSFGDLLIGLPGSDVDGLAGNDDIYYLGDGGTLDGGDGDNDIARVGYAPTGPGTIDLADSSLNSGYAQGLTLIDIEFFIGTNQSDHVSGDNGANFIATLGGDDTILGRSGDDFLTNSAGNNFSNGGSGNDTILGGGQSDTIEGRNGDDILSGGLGNDIFGYADANEGNDIITDFTSGDDVINLRLANVGGLDDLGIDTTSSASDTVLTFGSTQITLEGFTGTLTDDDFVFLGSGTPGADTLNGNRGDNTFFGLAGDDVISGRNGADELYGGDDNDSLRGGRNDDMLFGGDGIDVLNGGQGDDILFGGVHDDVLIGLDGADTYTGGSGADVFTLKGGLVEDTITDFEAGIDTLNLRNTGVTDFTTDVTQSDTGADRLLTWTNGGEVNELTLEGLAGIVVDGSDILT